MAQMWGLLSLASLLIPAGVSAEDCGLVKVYFASGCFWHVQHELIKAERDILGRSDAELTSLVGYAGGQQGLTDVCYRASGSQGFTEVVGLEIPSSNISAFAAVFWRLFKGKDRIDTMDVGLDYRAAVGLPGGMESPLLAAVQKAQEGNVAQTFTLEKGKGSDPDTLGVAKVWVYDTAVHPFYQAEVGHQFHDDFMPGGAYPQSYNDLRRAFMDSCRMRPTACPAYGYSDANWDQAWSTQCGKVRGATCPGAAPNTATIAPSARTASTGDSNSGSSGGSGGGSGSDAFQQATTTPMASGGSGGGSGGGAFTTTKASAGSGGGSGGGAMQQGTTMASGGSGGGSGGGAMQQGATTTVKASGGSGGGSGGGAFQEATTTAGDSLDSPMASTAHLPDSPSLILALALAAALSP